MRFTITIDNDIVKQLEYFKKAGGDNFTSLVNTALRLGLQSLTAKNQTACTPFRQETVSLGKCKIGSLENISGVIVQAEGETHP